MFADEEEEEKKAKTKLGVSADILAQFKKAKHQRKASTEDDEDEDDTGAAHDDDDNDGVDADPLDAYMQSVDHEVTKIKQQDAVRIRNRKMLGILGKSKRGEKISDADGAYAAAMPSGEGRHVAARVIAARACVSLCVCGCVCGVFRCSTYSLLHIVTTPLMYAR